MAKKRIGDLLRARGLVTEEQLNQGLEAQRGTSRRLGVTLVELGFLSEEQLASALADSLQLPRVDLAQAAVDWSAVHLLKPQLCEARGLFAFALESQGGRKVLVVAMSDPLDVRAIEEIEFTTGLKVSPRVASLSGIRAAILRYYHRIKPPPASLPPAPPAKRASARATPPADKPPPSGRRRPEAVRQQAQARALPPTTVPLRAGPAAPPADSRTVSEELALLFGQSAEAPDASQRLEVLVRLLIQKGVFSEAEWLAALRGR